MNLVKRAPMDLLVASQQLKRLPLIRAELR